MRRSQAPNMIVRKLAILIVNWRCPQNPRAGGAEVHLQQIARELVELGHSVTVLASGWRGAPARARLDGVVYRRVGNDHTFFWRHRAALRRMCRTVAYDLLVDDISKIPLGLGRCRLAARTLAWCHHLHGPMLYRELPWLAAHWIDRRERRMPALYGSTPILAVSQSTRHELISLGMASSRVGLVPNGVSVSTIRSHACSRSRRPLLVYLGRLQRYKNVACILRAFARIRAAVPTAELLVLGTGPDEPRLRRLARQLAPEAVTFRGYVSEAEKSEMLHRAWVALASSEKEGWGICILEANAAGTPVVASNVPGHRDAVRHEQTGLLYRFNDDQALAQHTLACLKNPARLQALSTAAREWANRFDWRQSAHVFLQWVGHFYPDLLVSANDPRAGRPLAEAEAHATGGASPHAAPRGEKVVTVS